MGGLLNIFFQEPRLFPILGPPRPFQSNSRLKILHEKFLWVRLKVTHVIYTHIPLASTQSYQTTEAGKYCPSACSGTDMGCGHLGSQCLPNFLR